MLAHIDWGFWGGILAVQLLFAFFVGGCWLLASFSAGGCNAKSLRSKIDYAEDWLQASRAAKHQPACGAFLWATPAETEDDPEEDTSGSAFFPGGLHW